MQLTVDSRLCHGKERLSHGTLAGKRLKWSFFRRQPMADRTVHYEAAFEAFLREKGIPCVVVDEAKKAICNRQVEL